MHYLKGEFYLASISSLSNKKCDKVIKGLTKKGIAKVDCALRNFSVEGEPRRYDELTIPMYIGRVTR